MNIKEIHDLINFISDKEMAGYHPPDKIDWALELSQMDEFNKYIPQRFAPWQEPHQAISGFKRDFDFITDANGYIDVSSASGYNTDEPFIYATMIDVAVADNSLPSGSDVPRHEVDWVNEAEIPARRNSQLIPMSRTAPFVIQTNLTEFRFYPNEEHVGTIRYIKKPPRPVFGYTQSGRTITYNPATSTQLEWSWQYQKRIIFGALVYLGINLTDQQLVQYGLTLSNQ